MRRAQGKHYNEPTPRLVRGLIEQGETPVTLGRLVGRDPSYIRQLARGTKVGTALEDFLLSLTRGEAPGPPPPLRRAIRPRERAVGETGLRQITSGGFTDLLASLERASARGDLVYASVAFGSVQGRYSGGTGLGPREVGLWGTGANDGKVHGYRASRVLERINQLGGGEAGLKAFLTQQAVATGKVEEARNPRRVTFNYQPRREL